MLSMILASGGVEMNAAIRFDGQADGWSRRRAKKAARLARVAPWAKGRVLKTAAIVEALQALIEPGDAVALEGDNQKQADFLSRVLVQADRQGNLYTGPNTEDTPTIVEASAFHDGVVVVQVNDIVDELPRVDIPAAWVDVIVAADRPYQMDAEGNFSTVTCGGSAA
jgi:hypothetical protein